MFDGNFLHVFRILEHELTRKKARCLRRILKKIELVSGGIGR
jgi:hypothetical protein